MKNPPECFSASHMKRSNADVFFILPYSSGSKEPQFIPWSKHKKQLYTPLRQSYTLWCKSYTINGCYLCLILLIIWNVNFGPLFSTGTFGYSGKRLTGCNSFCPMYMITFCGSDGQTYTSNECFLKSQWCK